MQQVDPSFPPVRLSLRQWQVFVAVARLGSTAAAANALALSQSAASAALNQLEHLTGQRGFDRTGKRLRLNAHGATLLPLAHALLDAAAGLEHLARQSHPAALRIGASTTIGNHVLPALLAAWLAHPLTPPVSAASTPPPVPSIRISNTRTICAAVADFALDVGLVEGPAQHPHLRAEVWMHDELCIIAAGDFPGNRASLTQLKAARWLLREPGSGTRAVTDGWLLPHLGEFAQSMELGSSEAIVGAVAAGLGLACLSAHVIASALAQGRIRQLTPPLPPMRRQYSLVTHRHKHPDPTLERFLALARERAKPPRKSRRPVRLR